MREGFRAAYEDWWWETKLAALLGWDSDQLPSGEESVGLPCDASHGVQQSHWHCLARCAASAACITSILGAATPTIVKAIPVNFANFKSAGLIGEPGAIKLGIFGSIRFKIAGNRFGKAWQQVLSRIEDEKVHYVACDQGSKRCPANLKRWRRIVNSSRGLTKLEQLNRVNSSVNRLIKYSPDPVAYGVKDYWATPLEFIKRRGDCEDFAILKFRTLLELGFRNDQLRIAVVKDKRRRALHAVAMATLDGKTYVLDNLHRDIIEHQRLLRYSPVFSANLHTQWAHIVTRKNSAIGASKRTSPK